MQGALLLKQEVRTLVENEVKDEEIHKIGEKILLQAEENDERKKRVLLPYQMCH